MPLINIGDLKGLTPLQQGRKIFENYDTYRDRGILGFLETKYPNSSPQSMLFTHIVDAVKRKGSLYFTASYEDVVDYALDFSSLLQRQDIGRYLGLLKERRERNRGTSEKPETMLNDAIAGYHIISEGAIQRIEKRNPEYSTDRKRCIPRRVDEQLMQATSSLSLSFIQSSSKSLPRDRELKKILKSAELFSEYISEAYILPKPNNPPYISP